MTYTEFLTEAQSKGVDVHGLPEALVKVLKGKGLKIATAESCTGGLVSKMITDISGASSVFDCGVCSYANEIKERVLGVKAESLARKGAVSAEVAAEMAKGVRLLSRADIGISTTGIAGPNGGTPQKPVGTVYIGVSTVTENYAVLANLGAKNATRDKIRQQAAYLAIYCGFKAASGENY